MALFYLLQTELHFAAPDKPGYLRYTVYLVSDSYIDMAFCKDIKVHMQWHFTQLLHLSLSLSLSHTHTHTHTHSLTHTQLDVKEKQEVKGMDQWKDLEEEEEEEEVIEESEEESEGGTSFSDTESD